MALLCCLTTECLEIITTKSSFWRFLASDLSSDAFLASNGVWIQFEVSWEEVSRDFKWLRILFLSVSHMRNMCIRMNTCQKLAQCTSVGSLFVQSRQSLNILNLEKYTNGQICGVKLIFKTDIFFCLFFKSTL